jgi:sterol 3beta-glucosyltransferase
MMEPTRETSKGHISYKLRKRKTEQHRQPSLQMPSRLQLGDDALDDVTAPARGGTPAASQFINQSVFSLIAAAGSRTDFNTRFDESSESEGEGEKGMNDTLRNKAASKEASISQKAPEGVEVNLARDTSEKKQRKRLSLQRIQHLSLKISKDKKSSRQENLSPSSDESSTSHPREAPMMSRLLTAEAEFQATTHGSDGQDQIGDRAESSPATLIATRLMEIFGFERPETVIREYPCWLLQSVLLQGYLYITRSHICFYAYLPKKANTIAMSGNLSKRGRSNPKYHRYWFSLKGDVLSYYANSSDLYFPQGNIDLRYGISAALCGEKDKQKDSKDFTVTTNHRTYYFKADSSSNAKEWVKSLQKTIFRSHNDGDSVKISLPVENIIDIEMSPVVEFAETVKIRVVESGDSYAIDEVFCQGLVSENNTDYFSTSFPSSITAKMQLRFLGV